MYKLSCLKLEKTVSILFNRQNIKNINKQNRYYNASITS